MSPLVIALGNESASDDGAALRALSCLTASGADRLAAGRPGATLLDLFEPNRAVVLMDVTQTGAAPGALVKMELARVSMVALSEAPVSSHGFGPAETFRLGAALGRAVPRGFFVGIEGLNFEVGLVLSEAVEAALGAYCELVDETIEALRDA